MLDAVASFSLIRQPWIPVLDLAGRRRLVSLAELFTQAAELRAVAGELPTQTAAILRLLLAILHRGVNGPEDERAWRTLWQRADLPAADIVGYLDDYQDRFDLLHPVTPFYQVADLHTEAGGVFGLERLIADVPNNAPYLTTRLGPGLERLTPAEAAVWLVHCQAYDTSGIKSGAVGDTRVKGGKGYPIGPASCGSLGLVHLEGRTLRDTLLLNLVTLDSDYLRQNPERDAPVWERDPHGPAEEEERDRGPHGVLNIYTWQSRRIRLFGDDSGITSAMIANGDRITWVNRQHQEPMSGWRRSANQEKKLGLPTVYLPGLHDHTRALWRGLASLLPTAAEKPGADAPTRRPPAISQWLARLRMQGLIDDGYRVTTRAVGVVYGNQMSVVDEVYHDSLTMTVQVFDPASPLATTIVDSAADAEAAVKALRGLAANLCRAAGGWGDRPEDPPAAAANRAAETAYAKLDILFRNWLGGLGPSDDPAQARVHWQQQAAQCVRRLGGDLVDAAGPHAWAGRYLDQEKKNYLSSARADMFFRNALRRALPLATAPETPPVPQEVPA
ncbi:type I-E CRISPR-associated protein Cse1/CasA [Micromonospora endophytica]|uniref:Type I-E CRISPR-associated protein Cse1/CasA n=1 Tax=Micromonospora endophytica TaxID=515350 RepID=A0A2W2CCJ9_9ACTN|nr:type I-E CRISPR-associated protein Cse1/CasA [Micromonospora endophytica]PZF97041.1 type I-E CRISPR-associated protein Cse1/CasA [Micromonospora endophytica]RIW40954.1 type I-E CRISPR-associated protein Cse1/CasA [Micromonospora endophytica]BCJ58925.1 CRISPR-associated protein CasA/Cse1 [Micromonospora endophytica]